MSGNAPSSTMIGLWRVSDSSEEYAYQWFSGNEEVIYNSSVPANISANSLAGSRTNVLMLPQTFEDPGSADVKTVPNIEITYETWTYTDDSGNYETYETTARASLYSILASVGNRLDMNRKLTFNITINLDSNLIIWAPDQSEWIGDDFNISI